MMQENRTVALTWSIFGSEALNAFYSLRWMLVLSVVLIAADLWWGINASRYRNEKIRLSRAGRRTFNKFVDYITYLLLGALFGLGIFEPLGITNYVTTSAIGLGFGCLFEVDSIIDHVCEVHGIKRNFNLRSLLVSLIKIKNKKIGEAIDKATKETNQTKEDAP